MTISDAQARATRKYQKEHYDQLAVRLPRGSREEFSNHAAAQGESLAAFVLRACRAQMERDNTEAEEKD